MPGFYKLNSDNKFHVTSWFYKPPADGKWHPVRNVFYKVPSDGKWHPMWLYEWDAGSWTPCSVPCGGGTQTRVVKCKRSDTLIVHDSFCEQSTKPSAIQACNTQTCTVPVYAAGDDWWILQGYNPTTGTIGPTYYNCLHNGPSEKICPGVYVNIQIPTDGKLYLYLQTVNRDHTWITGIMHANGKYGTVIASSDHSRIPIGSASSYQFKHGYATHWMAAVFDFN